MDKKAGPALLIGIMGKKRKPEEADDSSDGDEVKQGLAMDLIDALHQKDPLALYDALEAVVRHCSESGHEEPDGDEY